MGRRGGSSFCEGRGRGAVLPCRRPSPNIRAMRARARPLPSHPGCRDALADVSGWRIVPDK
eukprot:13943790-Alexandrium_andersonii.AAC.1